jgi:hypothetical protein
MCVGLVDVDPSEPIKISDQPVERIAVAGLVVSRGRG